MVELSAEMIDRLRGIAVGAAVGDALGMPLEFRPARPENQQVRNMLPGRLPAGSFTDDTEMALALVESLLAHQPLDPENLAQHFVDWLERGPDDIGIHTQGVLRLIASGVHWKTAARTVQTQHPENAANGSVMRCWPAAVANWQNLPRLLNESRLQSHVTHPHPECITASAFVNAMLFHLVHGQQPEQALKSALEDAKVTGELRILILAAPLCARSSLVNSGWVHHTLQSVVWGLLTTQTFEESVVQVANLGNDADTAAAVVGALAGAAYGLSQIPLSWREQLQGEWPIRSGKMLHQQDFIRIADRLAALN